MKLTRVSLTVHLLISSIRTFNWKILPRLLAVIIVQHIIWFCTIIVQVEIPSYTHMIVHSSIDPLRNWLVYTSFDQLWINSRSCNCAIRSSFRFLKLMIIVRVKNGFAHCAIVRFRSDSKNLHPYQFLLKTTKFMIVQSNDTIVLAIWSDESFDLKV